MLFDAGSSIPSLPLSFSANHTLPVLSTAIPSGPELPVGTCHSVMFKAEEIEACARNSEKLLLDRIMIATIRKQKAALFVANFMR
jgi:hypothetical protein